MIADLGLNALLENSGPISRGGIRGDHDGGGNGRKRALDSAQQDVNDTAARHPKLSKSVTVVDMMPRTVSLAKRMDSLREVVDVSTVQAFQMLAKAIPCFAKTYRGTT